MAEQPRSILDKVCVRREEPEDITKGGIIIPVTAQGKPHVGYVVSVGPDVDPEQVKVGDKVMIGEYTGTNFKLRGEEYVSLLMQDILFVLEDDGQDNATEIPIGIADAHEVEDEVA
jgi:chaperonin GroES